MGEGSYDCVFVAAAPLLGVIIRCSLYLSQDTPWWAIVDDNGKAGRNSQSNGRLSVKPTSGPARSR